MATKGDHSAIDPQIENWSVVDPRGHMQGRVIPGFYAGGEAVGGFNKHGLGQGHVQDYIAGTHAVRETSS